ncbi:hypothetical protein CERSUDRAFT_100227 [Gelatoporia subvermispora B]|uniref:NACHT domain-containing protein n=1 Tax=Ceriporiopsis subvermispora (strain B) TaxID=914234 RepID=M2P871_CERS8|nr:hypothetical protein CERSUDRAFT_100227 [Gelatoporia subvermispora B]
MKANLFGRLRKNKSRPQSLNNVSVDRIPIAPVESGERSAPTKHAEEWDVLLANIEGILEASDGFLSMVPVVGLSPAVTLVKSLVSKMRDARTITSDRVEVMRSINALIELLNATVGEASPQLMFLAPAERNQMRERLEHSSPLKRRIDTLVTTLHDILRSANEVKHSNWISATWHASRDAEVLDSIRQRIDDATNQFRIQGEINIQQLLAHGVREAHETTSALRRMELKLNEHSERSIAQRRELERERRERELSEKAEREDSERRRAEREEWRDAEQRTHERQMGDQEILQRLFPADASYKSYLTDEKSRLQPGTRKTILKDLFQWVKGEGQASNIYVLHGRAGMGKSSIMHALLRQLGSEQLGASFFFNRAVEDCRNAYRVFPTLAYQLASFNAQTRPIVSQAAREYLTQSPSQALEHQLQALIINSLNGLPGPPSSVLFVLDGVDECINSPYGVVSEMLQLICEAARKLPFLRVLIASRPETYIMDALHHSAENQPITFRDLQKEPGVDDDIRLFIDAEFRKCARRGRFALIEQRPNAVKELTNLSDGLFVYASTITRFLVQDKYYAVAIYDKLLASQGSMGPTRMYQKLDMLYGTILSTAFDELRDDKERMVNVQKVLAWIVLIDAPTGLSALHLEPVGIPVNVTMDVIERLSSVLNIDDEYGIPTAKTKACHASFPQFLMDKARCTDQAFLVEPPHGHAIIAEGMLRLLSRSDATTARRANSESAWVWAQATCHWTSQILEAEYDVSLCRSLQDFAAKNMHEWVTDVYPWQNLLGEAGAVDKLADIRNWCKAYVDPEDEVVTRINEVIGAKMKKSREY